MKYSRRKFGLLVGELTKLSREESQKKQRRDSQKRYNQKQFIFIFRLFAEKINRGGFNDVIFTVIDLLLSRFRCVNAVLKIQIYFNKKNKKKKFLQLENLLPLPARFKITQFFRA